VKINPESRKSGQTWFIHFFYYWRIAIAFNEFWRMVWERRMISYRIHKNQSHAETQRRGGEKKEKLISPFPLSASLRLRVMPAVVSDAVSAFAASG
jgi:hypothetical protein